MDKNKLIQYIIANMGHVIHHAVNSLKASGKLPKDASAADFWEHGIHGIMQAVHNYDPNKGDLNAYAKKKIMGLIQEHQNSERRNYVPRSLETDVREHARSQNPESGGQAVGMQQGSNRGSVESAGGSTDESGATNLSSIKSPDRAFADRNSAFVGSDQFKDKMQRYEGKVKQSQPAPAAAPAAPVAAQIEPKKTVVVRRAAMKPEQQERIKRIDAAKASQGNKE